MYFGEGFAGGGGVCSRFLLMENAAPTVFTVKPLSDRMRQERVGRPAVWFTPVQEKSEVRILDCFCACESCNNPLRCCISYICEDDGNGLARNRGF